MIRGFLRLHEDRAYQPKEIALRLALNKGSVRVALRRMLKSGEPIWQPIPGWYKYVADGRSLIASEHPPTELHALRIRIPLLRNGGEAPRGGLEMDEHIIPGARRHPQNRQYIRKDVWKGRLVTFQMIGRGGVLVHVRSGNRPFNPEDLDSFIWWLRTMFQAWRVPTDHRDWVVEHFEFNKDFHHVELEGRLKVGFLRDVWMHSYRRAYDDSMRIELQFDRAVGVESLVSLFGEFQRYVAGWEDHKDLVNGLDPLDGGAYG